VLKIIPAGKELEEERASPYRNNKYIVDLADESEEKNCPRRTMRPSGLEIKDPSAQQFPSPKTAICRQDQLLHK
jgi:hypothetical protein